MAKNTIDEILNLQDGDVESSVDSILSLQDNTNINIEPINIENNPITESIYSAGDKLKYLDKIRSSTIGPAIAGAIKLENPIDQYKKEFTSWEPQPDSSAMGALRQRFPNQSPIIDTPEQDYKQGEYVKGTLKQIAKNTIPKAYSAIENVLPSDLAGFAIDAATGELVMPKFGQGTINSLEESAGSNREKALVRISNQNKSDIVKNVDESLRYKKVGNTLDRYGLSQYIAKPTELQKQLIGTEDLAPNEIGIEHGVNKNKGIINELTDTVKYAANHFENKLPQINVNQIADDVYNKMAGEMGKKTSLVAFGPKEDFSTFESINNKLKTLTSEPPRSFKELIDMKRNAADFIYEIKNNPETYGVQGATDLKTYKEIWNWIDNHVNELARQDKDMASFARANSDLSDLLTAKEIVSGARTESLGATNALDAAIGMGVGGALGSITGHPIMGMSVGGGLAGARSMIGSLENSMPARFANTQQNAAEFLRSSPRFGQQVKNTLAGGYMANVPSIQEQIAMQKGLVENLADYQIPRDANEILANPKLAVAKVAQVTNDHKIVDMLSDALTNHPEKLETVLPVLIMQFPNLFETDIYNRVNGKILDPMVRQKAYQDVSNSGLSNTEKAILKDGLNRDGSLPKDRFK